jgi:hypothetical protein
MSASYGSGQRADRADTVSLLMTADQYPETVGHQLVIVVAVAQCAVDIVSSSIGRTIVVTAA